MGRITRRIGKSIDFVDGKGYANMSHEKTTRLIFERLAEYEEIGTVEEFTEIKELQTPKKPSIVNMQNTCQNKDCCETLLRNYNNCPWCGQKIDWSK